MNWVTEFSPTRTQLKRMPSVNLDEVLCVQKLSYVKLSQDDITGLGCVGSSDPSLPWLLDRRLCLCLNLRRLNNPLQIKLRGPQVICLVLRPLLDLLWKPSGSKTTHVCHHCGVHPNCFKLYPQMLVSNRSSSLSQGHVPLLGELLKALSFVIQFRGVLFPLCLLVDVLGLTPLHFPSPRLKLVGEKGFLGVMSSFRVLYFQFFQSRVALLPLLYIIAFCHASFFCF